MFPRTRSYYVVSLILAALATVGDLFGQAPFWQADTTFAPVLESGSGTLSAILPVAGGKVVLIGDMGQIVDGQRIKGTLARVNADGSLDVGFSAPEQNLYP